ncbi:DNA-directed RNA polymerase III subunit RPC3-like [Octopus vulgaris]|uniref:DNA-directed RNA polymerase III subunit RPC3 n=1 Tax=Octopus vulgaris TaxID=6645 RepID=A0AA36AL87_OCTVU|nr:DNA-directed RNA polymerase III subunit RPC3-like [Octopus vulgaris]
MSQSEIKLCKLIIRENFAETSEKVATILLESGPCPLKLLALYTNLKLDQVKRILAVLITHHIVKFNVNKKGLIEYNISIKIILSRVRFPIYICTSKTLYGDAAELLVEELLQRGEATMETVVNKVTERLNEALEASGHPKISSTLVKDKFVSLVQTHFIQRCLTPMRDSGGRVISLGTPEDPDICHVIPVNTQRRRSDSPPSAKAMKISENNTDTVYWKVDFDRFHQHFRDQAIISAMLNKIDKKASEIIRTMLRISETNTTADSLITTPISINEIFINLPKELEITKPILEQYLSVMCDDSQFVFKAAEAGGGMYEINIHKSLTELCKSHIESVVQERFGSKSLRIFRILLLKQHLEQKQIEEYAMIPAKEVKEIMYNMFADGFLFVTEVSKAPDHAPSRTFFLFRVEIPRVARMLLKRCYQAIGNAMLRREHEVKEHRRLLDKQQRVEAIIASLDQSVDESQKVEVEQTITPAERNQLAKVKQDINKLDQCEIQLDSTMFLLENYLHYSKINSQLS